MKVQGQHYRTIWPDESNAKIIRLIDQRFLPHQFVIEEVGTPEQMAAAIKEMHVRGAGLIGAAAGYGMYLATLSAAPGASFEDGLDAGAAKLKATRPTAVNLAWAVERQMHAMGAVGGVENKRRVGVKMAQQTAAEDRESG